jgi:hypothetical protein
MALDSDVGTGHERAFIGRENPSGEATGILRRDAFARSHEFSKFPKS